MGCKSTGIVPVLETNITLVADTCVDADTENHEADDREALDEREPELDLTVAADRHKVEEENEDPEHGDENTLTELLIPIVDDDAGRGEFQSESDCP